MLSYLVLKRTPKAGAIALATILLLMALILAFMPLRSQAQGRAGSAPAGQV